MKTVNSSFPAFNLKAVVSSDMTSAFQTMTELNEPKKWKIYFFWPKDFTFVCPTEIKAFNDLVDEFADRDAVVIGGSTDSEFVHLAWRQHKEELRNLKFPMLSDIKGDLARALGIMDEDEGVMQRATFIVDPDNIIRFTMVTDLNVGRNPKEVLRVLDALQTDELCPCNWQPGQAVLQPGEMQ